MRFCDNFHSLRKTSYIVQQMVGVVFENRWEFGTETERGEAERSNKQAAITKSSRQERLVLYGSPRVHA